MSSVSSQVSESSPAKEPAPLPAPVRRRPRFGPRERHDFLVFLAFAGPNILLIIFFSYRPVLTNLYYSTLNWTLGAATASAVGFDNYVRFFTSDDTLDILRVTTGRADRVPVPIDEGLIRAEQQTADRYFHAGVLTKRVDVRAGFDRSFG